MEKIREEAQQGSVMPDRDIIRELIAAALEMRKKAYCPYSGYSVGAALLAGNGKVFGGCNIENAAYPDTVCGERGSGLSEGQSHRIAIARGLLRPGNILLFDEFSSSLDPETEDRLIKNITELASDKTMIFITHRERIAEFCDRELKL